MPDIVGHSMSRIAVKATVANHIAAERPAETRAAPVAIERTSRAALTEIRRLPGVRRSDTDPAAELSPSPGTADLPDRLRTAGDLPPAAELTVSRIVEEPLTNVVELANADRCQATVCARDGGVHIEILDDGHGPRSSGRGPAGQGLIGIRERVTTHGGRLTAGPRSEGGFQVIADIPYVAVEQAA